MCTYSLAAEPGTASDHRPVSASNTPSTTKPHTAAAEVVTTTGESATNTPMTSAAQSCQRRHVPTCSVAIATTSLPRTRSGLRLDWPAGQHGSESRTSRPRRTSDGQQRLDDGRELRCGAALVHGQDVGVAQGRGIAAPPLAARLGVEPVR